MFIIDWIVSKFLWHWFTVKITNQQTALHVFMLLYVNFTRNSFQSIKSIKINIIKGFINNEYRLSNWNGWWKSIENILQTKRNKTTRRNMFMLGTIFWIYLSTFENAFILEKKLCCVVSELLRNLTKINMKLSNIFLISIF